MLSGLGKTDKWVLKFETENFCINSLMGWQTSSNTPSELNEIETLIKFTMKLDFDCIPCLDRNGANKIQLHNRKQTKVF